MGRVFIDAEECYVRHENRYIFLPKYVIKLLSRLSYYCYDVEAFLSVVSKIRETVEKTEYDKLPEWIKLCVPKRYIKALSKHLLYLYELRLTLIHI